jgi:hypothetical protein
MKSLLVILSTLGCVLGLAVDRGGSGGKTWPSCQDDLSCSFQVIEGTTLAQRLTYMQTMQSRFFGPKFNCPAQWKNIEGVIQFFMDKKLGAPGTWVSYTDAGIVEAIQRGGAVALGLSANDGGNPATKLWADYMTKMKAGQLSDRSVRNTLHMSPREMQASHFAERVTGA